MTFVVFGENNRTTNASPPICCLNQDPIFLEGEPIGWMYGGVRASIDILRRLLNQQRSSQQLPPIRIGVGLHTDPLIMGITGGGERLEAATISDTFNTASRIESLSKYFGVPSDWKGTEQMDWK